MSQSWKEQPALVFPPLFGAPLISITQRDTNAESHHCLQYMSISSQFCKSNPELRSIKLKANPNPRRIKGKTRTDQGSKSEVLPSVHTELLTNENRHYLN